MDTRSSRLRCVIADDVGASRELLRRCLFDLNLDVDVCSDGLEAWESIQRTVPSLIITDIEMPRLNGLELLRQIRQSSSEQLRGVPVVLITSLVDCEISDIVREFGGATVIIKPISKETTCGVIQRLINGQSVEAIYVPGAAFAEVIGKKTISPTLRRLVRNAR